ncbi:hypothetical protein BN946_scf184845.g23 [Trametes cinnabarina]|uniref:Transmembrane protein n=1 Tax=Pycnoporus cinnabarinus TaxID=5643 RepID=A0A060SFH8_PYCCI|nr:hypothetical protein BN946_scf184845.g23 [Trametes cinnabarina]
MSTFASRTVITLTPRSHVNHLPRRSGSAVSAASSAMPSLIPAFSFASIPPLQACADATIHWNYSGADQELSLFVSPASSGPPTALSLVAYPLAATSETWTWQPVNVSAGSYEMTAVGQGFSSVSLAFQVVEGTTTSCLTSPTLSAPSNGTAHAPVGVIVGGAVGGVAMLLAIVGACIYFTLRCSSVPGYRWRSYRSDMRREREGAWSGLSSHVSIVVPELPSQAVEEEATVVPSKDKVLLGALPRLEPNRRKPSVSSEKLLSATRTPTRDASQPQPAPAKPLVHLDDELPLPPTVHTPSAESIRSTRLARSRTLASTSEATSVVWLRRHAMASFTRAQTPTSGASAAPSSPASQLYWPKESIWRSKARAPNEVQTAGLHDMENASAQWT